jgi:hypothetical protein
MEFSKVFPSKKLFYMFRNKMSSNEEWSSKEKLFSDKARFWYPSITDRSTHWTSSVENAAKTFYNKTSPDSSVKNILELRCELTAMLLEMNCNIAYWRLFDSLVATPTPDEAQSIFHDKIETTMLAIHPTLQSIIKKEYSDKFCLYKFAYYVHTAVALFGNNGTKGIIYNAASELTKDLCFGRVYSLGGPKTSNAAIRETIFHLVANVPRRRLANPRRTRLQMDADEAAEAEAAVAAAGAAAAAEPIAFQQGAFYFCGENMVPTTTDAEAEVKADTAMDTVASLSLDYQTPDTHMFPQLVTPSPFQQEQFDQGATDDLDFSFLDEGTPVNLSEH